jgi:lysophospholipase L1-like esterase
MSCLLLSAVLLAQEAHSPVVTLLADGKEPVRIVCFGDSITGVYYHTGSRRAYPDMLQLALQRLYPKAKVSVHNAGISGHNTRHALARLDKDVLKLKPHLVTVMFGMNDLVAVPLDEFKANLGEIIRRCRKASAEVLLCTQNDILDEGGRSRAKLAEYTAAIHQMARAHKIAVARCNEAYNAVRQKDAFAFELLMSDAIHPNMDGHKLFAVEIARALTGKQVSLADVGSPTPAIPKTLALLKEGKTIKVLAMPPYDKLIGPALQKLQPGAKVEVTTWATAGQALPEIEKWAREKVRGMGMDLVLIAIPLGAAAQPKDRYIRSYAWVMNWSLSFAHQQWDCIALPPSTAQPEMTPPERERDALARRLIAAQDLGTIVRSQDDRASVEELLARWLREQRQTNER